jgi:hypothetical protein
MPYLFAALGYFLWPIPVYLYEAFMDWRERSREMIFLHIPIHDCDGGFVDVMKYA